MLRIKCEQANRLAPSIRLSDLKLRFYDVRPVASHQPSARQVLTRHILDMHACIAVEEIFQKALEDIGSKPTLHGLSFSCRALYKPLEVASTNLEGLCPFVGLRIADLEMG